MVLCVKLHKAAVNMVQHYLFKQQIIYFFFRSVQIKCISIKIPFWLFKPTGSSNSCGFQIRYLKLKCKNPKKNKHPHYQKSLPISWTQQRLRRTLDCTVWARQPVLTSRLCDWLWSQQDSGRMLPPLLTARVWRQLGKPCCHVVLQQSGGHADCLKLPCGAFVHKPAQTTEWNKGRWHGSVWSVQWKITSILSPVLILDQIGPASNLDESIFNKLLDNFM